MAKRLLIAISLLTVSLVTVWHAISLFKQNLTYTAAQTEVSFWGRAEYHPTPTTIERTGKQLSTLLQQNPSHPEYSTLQANYQSWRAYWSDSVEQTNALNQEAVTAQYKALQSRPAHRQSWQKMLEYASRTPDGAAMLKLAQNRVDTLNPAG